MTRQKVSPKINEVKVSGIGNFSVSMYRQSIVNQIPLTLPRQQSCPFKIIVCDSKQIALKLFIL